MDIEALVDNIWIVIDLGVLFICVYIYIFLIFSGASFGGKGSTDYVVKGSHKKVPQELIHELKAICQVFISSLYIFWSDEF